jgi:hypothetical protein
MGRKSKAQKDATNFLVLMNCGTSYFTSNVAREETIVEQHYMLQHQTCCGESI